MCTNHKPVLLLHALEQAYWLHVVDFCVQIAWRLHRMALNASHNAFVGFAIDGIPKKIAQTDGLWTVMRGSAADNDTPTVTLDFDFVWQVRHKLTAVAWATHCLAHSHPSAHLPPHTVNACLCPAGLAHHGAQVACAEALFCCTWLECHLLPLPAAASSGQLASTVGCCNHPVSLEGLPHQKGSTTTSAQVRLSL